MHGRKRKQASANDEQPEDEWIVKEIADRCEINKKMTFHTARHTFATTVTLTDGVPIETVSKLSGHKILMTTQ